MQHVSGRTLFSVRPALCGRPAPYGALICTDRHPHTPTASLEISFESATVSSFILLDSLEPVLLFSVHERWRRALENFNHTILDLWRFNSTTDV
jgi:hypothetical protein